jgi:hypothetical protein
VQFRLVVDMTWAIVMEVYREYGMKFEEATQELNGHLADPETPQAKKVREPDNDASLAMLQSMMGGSDFGGPRG